MVKYSLAARPLKITKMKFKQFNYDFKEQSLWKYMDIHKFLHFIHKKSLYFTRLDKFEDPNEGLPESIIRRIYESLELFPPLENLNPLLFKTEEERKKEFENNKKILNEISNIADKIQKYQFASCWFIGDRESYAMWNLYSSKDSIAIKINPHELITQIELEVEKFSNEPSIIMLACGPVSYNKVYPPEYDYSKYQSPNVWYSGLKKDLSYIFEKEYRFLAISENKIIDQYELVLENLFDLKFDIITHPKMEKWMYENIQSILIHHGIDYKLTKSNIKLRPSS